MELGCWAERGEKERKNWAVRVGRVRGEGGGGPLRRGSAGWAERFGLGWVSGLGFYFLLPFSFSNTLKLFEFKHKFEFKPYALNQNKTMLQHECTNKLNLR